MFKYSSEMILFIQKNYPCMNNNEFTKLFNETFNTYLVEKRLRGKANSLGVYSQWKIYTPEMLNFIKENCHKMPRRDFVVMFNKYFGVNKTVNQINDICITHGYSNKQTEKTYTPEMLSFIKENCNKTPRRKLASIFNEIFEVNKTALQINAICARYGYSNRNKRKIPRKIVDFLRENRCKIQISDIKSELNNKFGINLSTRDINIICANNNITRGFKKYDIGDEVADSTGRVLIKDKNRKWILKKEYIYEQGCSKVERDEIVIFIDENNKNFCPENLFKIKKNEKH